MRIVEEPPGLPPRPLDGHKGLFGRVLIVGGSRDMIGAPALAGAAALRMGSGLVQIAMPREVLA
jgi:NAD(P)H-hydrate epimerase